MYHVSETNTEMTPPILRPFLWDLALDVVLVKHLTAGAAQLLDLLAEEAGDVLLAVGRVGEAGVGVRLEQTNELTFQAITTYCSFVDTCPLGPRDSVSGQEKPSISSEKKKEFAY